MARSSQPRESISELTTRRLSVYLRCLAHLEALDIKTVSSREMATRFHLNSAQIRKDLACFGEFGIRGVGYDVARLKAQLTETLGIDRTRSMIIAGAGNLGMALAGYDGYNSSGFRVVALVDSDPEKIGRRTPFGIEVHSLDRLPAITAEHGAEIGVIAVPAANAQAVYDAMVDAGIRAVLNFAPTQIHRRAGVKLRSVDLRINLESLSFQLRNSELGAVFEEPA